MGPRSLREAYVAGSAAVTPPTYTDTPLTAGMLIRAVNITELRNAVVALP